MEGRCYPCDPPCLRLRGEFSLAACRDYPAQGRGNNSVFLRTRGNWRSCAAIGEEPAWADASRTWEEGRGLPRPSPAARQPVRPRVWQHRQCGDAQRAPCRASDAIGRVAATTTLPMRLVRPPVRRPTAGGSRRRPAGGAGAGARGLWPVGRRGDIVGTTEAAVRDSVTEGQAIYLKAATRQAFSAMMRALLRSVVPAG